MNQYATAFARGLISQNELAAAETLKGFREGYLSWQQLCDDQSRDGLETSGQHPHLRVLGELGGDNRADQTAKGCPSLNDDASRTQHLLDPAGWSSSVKRLVAMDPDCGLSTLEKLSLDGDETVLAAVAANPSSTVALLHHLGTDDSSRVRISVARNPHVGMKTLNVLTQDHDPAVAEEAHLRLTSLREASERRATLDDETTYGVVLSNRGPRPIQAIRELQDLMGLGLAESLALSEGVGKTIANNVDSETANYLIQRLAGTGASAIMVATPIRHVS